MTTGIGNARSPIWAADGGDGMSIREDVELYTKLSGEDGSQETIATIGAYLRGYGQGKADAEPKRGKWIDDGSELGCQCSQCGKTLDEYINCGTEYMTLTEIPKFCPNCGADMRGEHNETD